MMDSKSVVLICAVGAAGLGLVVPACSDNSADGTDSTEDPIRRACKGNPHKCDGGVDIPDVTTDTPVDTSVEDVALDTGVDASVDDAAPDTGVDASSDDAAPDTGVDASVDDAAQDAGVDASVVCTSFTYSDFGPCQPGNTQTRTVLTQSPAGCTGGDPVLTQACTYDCSSYTYSDFGPCEPNNTQARTILTQSPAGCVNTGTAVLTQACTFVSLANDLQPHFTQHCAVCHTAGGPAPNLTAGQTYGQVVNVAALTCASAVRVVPGNPDASWLMQKITVGGTLGTCGAGAPSFGGDMAVYFGPAGSSELAEHQSLVKNWILNGAPDN
jgi:hypothetical protein